jgi:hypothetical protein
MRTIVQAMCRETDPTMPVATSAANSSTANSSTPLYSTTACPDSDDGRIGA